MVGRVVVMHPTHQRVGVWLDVHCARCPAKPGTLDWELRCPAAPQPTSEALKEWADKPEEHDPPNLQRCHGRL
jgi:hypothetical protein